MKRMKKLIAFLMTIALCACLFVGCSGSPVNQSSTYNEDNPSMFVTIEYVSENWRVVYHKDTKVMYAVSAASYNRGVFTVMLNPDGTPMIWEGN
jgi:hypothetical protein